MKTYLSFGWSAINGLCEVIDPDRVADMAGCTGTTLPFRIDPYSELYDGLRSNASGFGGVGGAPRRAILLLA